MAPLKLRSSEFTLFSEVPKIANVSRSINVLGVASDVAIAVTLIFLLQRSRTGFKRSETIINRLILFTINTGLLTSMCAIMSLISVSAFFLLQRLELPREIKGSQTDLFCLLCRLPSGQPLSSISHSSFVSASVRRPSEDQRQFRAVLNTVQFYSLHQYALRNPQRA